MTDATTADGPRAGASIALAPSLVHDSGDPAAHLDAQYAALRTGALLVDQSARDLWLFGGAQARAMLTGLVTNDVGALAPGQGCYAAALTPKGRIIADVRVYAVGDGQSPAGVPPTRPADPAASPTHWLDGVALVVDVPARAATGWEAMVRKFVNPRGAPYRRAGNAVRAFGVYGTHARDAVAAAFGAAPSALAALAPYAHATFALDDATLLCARIPDLGGPDTGHDGFVLLVPAAAYDAAWARVADAVPGVVTGSDTVYTVARVEAGYPEWGLDIDDTTLPQEANFDEIGAISYTKGCYTGQEVVARIHFRGHVNRHLRGLAFPLDATPAPDAAPIPPGATLVDESEKPVGDVRTSARSPRLGGIALGMVRREVPLGAALRARWTDAGGTVRERDLTVTALPFPR